MKNKIVTIGRQFGSGGRYIGEELAKRMNCKFYDKELLMVVSRESGIGKEFFERVDENKSGGFLHSVTMGFNMHSMILPTEDYLSSESLFTIQAKVMRKLAETENFVMVGRCADYILREYKPLRVFITGNMEDRIKRVAKRRKLSHKAAEELIRKTDKDRASYYTYYTDQSWGDSKYFDITINSSLLGEEQTIDLLFDIVERYYKI
ncbi:MAG: AAA family ATPase [Marinifilaceae bacterium]